MLLKNWSSLLLKTTVKNRCGTPTPKTWGCHKIKKKPVFFDVRASARFSDGFTLMEVLIALFILTSSVYVLFDIQIKSVFRTFRDREIIERVFLVKRDCYELFMDTPDKYGQLKKKRC